MSSAPPFEAAAAEIESRLGLQAFVHALDLKTGRQLGSRESDSAVSASVFKVPVLVEVFEQIAAGQRQATDRVELAPGEYEVLGGTGTAAYQDHVSLSLRDMCLSMMSVSDNRATDAIVDLVGLESINARMRSLGLQNTVIEGDCAHIFSTLEQDEAACEAGQIQPEHDDVGAPVHLRALDPGRATRTTAAETTELLRRIWDADGLDAEGCAEMRRILGLQVWPHRLRSGFPDGEIGVSGKTGTLRHIRNEVGVVEYPDGGAYAVAVFLRIPTRNLVVPDYDRAIGELAAAGVGELRED